MKTSIIYINNNKKVIELVGLLFIISLLVFLLAFSKSNFLLMNDVVSIFLTNVFPALFPFILFSNLLVLSNYNWYIINCNLSKVLSKIFHITPNGASAVILGFLLGYPNGAKYVNTLYESRKISFREASFLLSFINNASPVYILSSIGIGIFSNISIGILLLMSHIFSSLIIGLFLSYKKQNNILINSLNLKRNNIIQHNPHNENVLTPKIELNFDILLSSIKNSLLTIGNILGFMVIFNLLHNYIYFIICKLFGLLKIFGLFKSINTNYIQIFLLSIFEVTSGVKNLGELNFSPISIITLASIFLGFSSLCIILQIFACICKNKFSLRKLIKYKIYHGILSGIISYILMTVPHIKEKISSSITVSSNIDNLKNIAVQTNFTSVTIILNFIYLILLLAIIIICAHNVKSN